MNNKRHTISVVIPVYNEEMAIELFINELFKVLANMAYIFEVIVVDDGSDDNTVDILKRLQKKHRELKFLSFTRNFGHQFALLSGIERASGSAVVMMDADLQHPPSLIPELIENWESGTKVVQTIRKDIKTSFFKKFTSKIFYSLINIISDVYISPASSDFRLIDRVVINQLLKFKEADVFLRGLIPWLGFETSYIKFEVNSRLAGKSKYSIIRMIKFAFSGISAFSILPLKITISIGLIISLISFLLGLESIYSRLFTNQVVPGWTSIMIGVFFIGGLLLIFLGVLGGYLGKVFLQVKNRPRYIIKELSGFEDKE